MSIVCEMACVLAFPAFLALLVPLAAEDPPAPGRYEPLPEGDGLAARYPGDLGIELAPAVVFADGFEDIEDDAIATGARQQKGMRWDEAWHTVRIAREPANVHGGKQAVEIRHEERMMSHGTGKEFKEGFDTLHVRYYMKLHKEFPGCHHVGMSMWAGAPGVVMRSGTATSATGVRPNGQNHFVVVLDAARPSRRSSDRPPGRSNIYCYHMDQVGDYGDQFFPSGRVRPRQNTGLYGADFIPRPDFTAELDRWHCYEFMVRANTPGERDGRVAFWVDGVLRGDFPNLRLRNVDTLKVNNIHLSSYASRIRPNQTLWYDDVVVATSYIGPQVSVK